MQVLYTTLSFNHRAQTSPQHLSTALISTYENEDQMRLLADY